MTRSCCPGCGSHGRLCSGCGACHECSPRHGGDLCDACLSWSTTHRPGTRGDVIDRLAGYTVQLGDDELEALVMVAEGLARGRAVYGELHVERDRRDFATEAGEELRDCMVYTAAALLKLRRGTR